MTPLRPTFSMAAEIISPISMLPPAEMDATLASSSSATSLEMPLRTSTRSDGLFHTARELHRVGTSHDNLHTFRNHRRREHSSGGGTVTGFVVRLLGRLSDELERRVAFNRILARRRLDGDTIVHNLREPYLDSSTTLRPFGPRVTPTTLASLSTPFCIFFNVMVRSHRDRSRARPCRRRHRERRARMARRASHAGGDRLTYIIQYTSRASFVSHHPLSRDQTRLSRAPSFSIHTREESALFPSRASSRRHARIPPRASRAPTLRVHRIRLHHPPRVASRSTLSRASSHAPSLTRVLAAKVVAVALWKVRERASASSVGRPRRARIHAGELKK